MSLSKSWVHTGVWGVDPHTFSKSEHQGFECWYLNHLIPESPTFKFSGFEAGLPKIGEKVRIFAGWDVYFDREKSRPLAKRVIRVKPATINCSERVITFSHEPPDAGAKACEVHGRNYDMWIVAQGRPIVPPLANPALANPAPPSWKTQSHEEDADIADYLDPQYAASLISAAMSDDDLAMLPTRRQA